MLSKRKACVALGIAALVLLMLASQSIQRKHFLSLSVATEGQGGVPFTPPLIFWGWSHRRAPLRPCGCPESCVSDLSESDWFRRRYDPRQRPVLRNAKDRLNPDALNWWLVRTARRTSKTHAVHTIFANIVETNLTCAMNKAVTRGFEKDVGNRTTHHFVYPESAVDVGRGVSLILLPFKLRDMEWLSSALSTGHVKMTYMRVRVRVEADKDKVLVVSPAFFKYVHERWTERHGRYPSTGMLAIVFALHICDQVSVFGYGADKQGNWHHYWEENRYAGAFRKTGVHSADFEMQVIRQLAEEGRALHRCRSSCDWMAIHNLYTHTHTHTHT
uniref:ST3 beta-galactoside alpha-2,3-sialyltransferase 8 n=1 Tax=Hippocampus comes TaxID=109280 RepID=A0A3Q3DEI4_HIPCM